MLASESDGETASSKSGLAQPAYPKIRVKQGICIASWAASVNLGPLGLRQKGHLTSGFRYGLTYLAWAERLCIAPTPGPSDDRWVQPALAAWLMQS